VTLGVGWIGLEGMEEEDSQLLYPRGSPPQPVHPSNQIWTITSTPFPPFRHPHDPNLILHFCNFLISLFHKQ